MRDKNRWKLWMTCGLLLLAPGPAIAEEYGFFVAGDPQYLAEKSAAPERLDPFSEGATSRFIELLARLPGQQLPKRMGGGRVASNIHGVLVTGDLIDSADKSGKTYEAMQRFEWQRFTSDFGLTGKDGKLPFPTYEVHGNHDGPQGDTFVVAEIVNRSKGRPHIVNRSPNGLHYSFNFGPLHIVALGLFVGEGDGHRPDFHYAPRNSLAFVIEDLKTHVGDSGRPVAAMFHLHPNAPAFDWPPADRALFWQALQPYNVVALFHGHTHASPPSRLMWDGKQFARELPAGLDVFNPDDAAASKADPRDPTRAASTRHGLLYATLIDEPGTARDRFIIRSLLTRDGWKTHEWGETWTRSVSCPDNSTSE